VASAMIERDHAWARRSPRQSRQVPRGFPVFSCRGAQAPRHQPEPSSARPRGQGPPPAPGGPVPGPDTSLGNNRSDRGHPLQRPRGPGPVQSEQQGHPA